jgi:uncharacterized protein (DUF4415 family)
MSEHDLLKNGSKVIMNRTPRRPTNPLDAAEALFKPVTKAKAPAAPMTERKAVPSTREPVSIRIDTDVLAFFQEDGPGWQERINAALRRAMEAGR